MEEKYRLLVVDDDPGTLTVLGGILEARGEYDTLRASSGREALEILRRENLHLVLTDLVMPSIDGLELTKKIKEIDPNLGVIIVTAYASIETAVQAMRAGASDYITKPVIPEELLLKVQRVLDQFKLKREVGSLRKRLARWATLPDMVGQSKEMQRLTNLVRLVADRNVPVVIIGESGTGKELVAKAIHALSHRAGNAFVPINCAGIPDNLLESELFGYVKGAFTDAVSFKRGLFEEADGGTLFLDEISCASAAVQMKLLRVLQDGEIRRLGSTTNIPTNARILVATNIDLKKQVKKGLFREDLFYRLNVVEIRIPPLRDRIEDIPILVDHFIRIHADHTNPAVRGISEEALAKLMNHSWPGNVREIENVIQRAMVLCRTDEISVRDIAHPGGEELEPEDNIRPLEFALYSFRKSYFQESLKRWKGNVKRVAEEAGVSRKNVYEHLKKLNLNPETFREKR